MTKQQKIYGYLCNMSYYVENHMHIPFKFDTSLNKIVNKGSENYDE